MRSEAWRPAAAARNRSPREARDPALQALRPGCEELAARIRRQLPAVVGRRAPKEPEAPPGEPKTARVERGEAGARGHGTVLLHTPPSRASLTPGKSPPCLILRHLRAIVRQTAPCEISGAKRCRCAVGGSMTKKLTEAAVKRAHAPRTGQVFLWDGEVRGFGVRILPGGSKTFWFQYRPHGGKSRMVRIGVYPGLSIRAARKVAHRFVSQVADGGNPAADRHAERMRDKATLRILLAED